MNKYEQLIEFIINEQEDKARELFHNIVVEKSREIYESLIDEDDLAEVGGDNVESMVDEITMDEEGMSEGEEDDTDDSEDSEHGETGMPSDIDGELDADEGDGAIEDRVLDLEDDIEELKAKFDRMLGQDDEGAGMGGEMDVDVADAGIEYGDEGDEEDEEMEGYGMMEAKADKKDVKKADKKEPKKMTEAEWLREYVDTINKGYPGNNTETGEVGAGGTAAINKASVVAGKNDMGGNAVGGSPDEASPDNKAIPQPNNQYAKGRGDLPHAREFKNVPGADAGKTSYKAKAPTAKTSEVAGTDKHSPVAK